MSANKNKKIRAVSNNSNLHHNSSQNVNLKCVSSLVGSDNCLYKQTNAEYHDNTALSTIKFDTFLENHKFGCPNKEQPIIDHESTSYGSLKNASIIIEKISNDDIILNENSKRLKNAILTKTKETFDRQDELSVKTCTILSIEDNQSNASANSHVACTHAKEKMPIISDTMNKIEYKNKRSNLNQSINNTLKDKCSNESIKEQRKQNRLKRKNLINMEKHDTNNDTNIRDNDVNLKYYTSKPCLLQSKSKNHSNYMITENNKKSCTLNASLNTSYKTISSSTTSSITQNQPLFISNISEHENTFTTIPIGCSTMINDKISDAQHEVHSQTEDSLAFSLNEQTKKDVASMEITDACEGFVLNDKLQSSLRHVTKKTQKLSNNSVFEEKTSLQMDSNSHEFVHGISKKFMVAALINNDIEQDTEIQLSNISIETDSVNTVQTSLNVNTSVDVVNQSDKSIDDNKQNNEKQKCKNFDNKHEGGAYLTLLQEPQESTNTICTSLQMNTSLSTSNRLQKKDIKENRANTINIYKMMDKNLAEKLKNIFTPCNEENNFNGQNTINEEAHVKSEKINVTISNNEHRIVTDKVHSSNQSYIEGTPYPTCRSVLLKSQLKQNAAPYSLYTNKLNNNESKEENFTETHFLKAKSCFLEQNGSVKPSNSCKEQAEITSIKSQTSMLMKKFTNGNKLEKDQSIKNVAPDKSKCKKKLLPLHEYSQLSFSPVEKQYSPPRCLIFRKKFKKGKNKCNKPNLNSIKCDKKEEKKDHEEKKQRRKPKKVISKKIVVKKIVNQDILRKLEESRENFNKVQENVYIPERNSSNDFQSLKRPTTTHFPRKKTQRINIVATGLSNEDKSIVKSVVKALGFAKIESNVTKRTTHVVTTGVRTINLLHGIVRGCWLISLEWVLKSLENNAWLNPEEYEMAHFSKAVLENRKDRQLFGTSYVPELFAACGYIYVARNTTPPCNVLKDLVKAAGGCIIENPEAAKIVISAEGLKESWVLDCITTGELQPYSQYQRH